MTLLTSALSQWRRYLPPPWLILAIGFAACLWCTLCAYLAPPMYDDFAIFRYAGWRITQGVPLFEGVWDHKSPLIFWFSAAGDWLTPGCDIGVDTLLCVVICGALAALYGGLKRFLPARVAALCATCTLLGAIAYGVIKQMSGTALQTVECLTLCLDAFAFCLWARCDWRQAPRGWVALLLGGLVAGGLLFKANFVGLGAFLMIAWGLEAWETRSLRALLKRGAWSFAGFALALGGVAAIYALSGTFPALWDAAWHFNACEYRDGSVGSLRLITLAKIFFRWRLLPKSPFLPLYGPTVAVVALGAWGHLRSRANAQTHLLGVALGGWFAAESLIVWLSGDVYEHYLIMGYLPLFALAGLGLCTQGGGRTVWVRRLLALTLVMVGGFFVASLACGTRQRLAIAAGQRTQLTLPEIQGRPVAVHGFISTAKLMRWNRAYTRQKYAFHFTFPNNPARQARVIRELVESLNAPETAAFLTESDGEALAAFAKPYPEVVQALAQWEYVRTLALPMRGVHLWRRRAGAREAEALGEGQLGPEA